MSERAPWTQTAYSFTIVVYDSSNTAVTGLVNANFTKKLALNDANSAVAVTVTEIDSVNLPGWYKVTYTPNANGHWCCLVTHATYNVRGWQDEIQVYSRSTDDLAYPATTGRSILVNSDGSVAPDWANVKSPTTTVGLTGTTIATSQTVGSVTGAVGSVTGNVGNVAGDVQGKVLGGGASAITGTGAQVDKTGYTLSAAGVQAIWDALTSALTTANSIGKRLADDVDATISSRLASSGYTAPPSVAAIAAAILATPANLLATDAGGRVTVGSIVASAIDAAQITAGAAQFLADQLLDRANAVEAGGFTVRKALRAIISATASKVSGMDTGSPVFRSADDSANRISATVDANGNRTAVTFTL